MKLSERQIDVLDSLSLFKDWVTPRFIGARDGSHHSATLRDLAKRGLVDRKKLHAMYCYNGSTYRQKLVNNRWVVTKGHPPHKGCCCKGSCRYKLTRVGKKTLRQFRQ